MKKNTLIMQFPNMSIGGIQQNFAELMRHASNTGHRVIWLYLKPMRIAEAYMDLLGCVETVEYSNRYSDSNLAPDLRISPNESIVWVTAHPSDMHRVLLFANTLNCQEITPLYIVSNTKGRFNYIENYYWGPFKGAVHRYYKTIVNKWAEKGLIRYFDIRHFDTYSQIYGIEHSSPMDLVWKEMYVLPPIDLEALDKRVARKEFNIVTVTRFDFPHKRYLLGLIKDYAQLKRRYINIKLHIIGYGQDEMTVRNHIAHLPESARKDVILYGQKSESDIKYLMKNMHLNISVAACVGLGAKLGVLSIPARNFCGSECEVYGYLPGSRNMTVATEPGLRAIDFIEEVINMTDEEYRKKCLDSYNAYEISDVDPDYMLRQSANISDFSFEKQFSAFFKLFVKTRDYFWKLGDMVSSICLQK